MTLKFDSFKNELIEPSVKTATILNIFIPEMVKMAQKTTNFLSVTKIGFIQRRIDRV